MAGTVKASHIQHDVNGQATTFKDGAGIEIGQLCKAWCNFTGAAPPTINGSFNTSSVTRSIAGLYIYNMSIAMTDSNYSSSFGGNQGSSPYNAGYHFYRYDGNGAATSSSFRLESFNLSGTLNDCGASSINVVR